MPLLPKSYDTPAKTTEPSMEDQNPKLVARLRTVCRDLHSAKAEAVLDTTKVADLEMALDEVVREMVAAGFGAAYFSRAYVQIPARLKGFFS